MSFVCRCSHPVSQMKAEYRSVDTLSSAPEHKPSVLSRISSSLPSMRKSTLRSGLINKIRTSDEGSPEKCIASNQLLQHDLKQNESNICGDYFTSAADNLETYYGQYLNLLRNVHAFSPDSRGGHTRKRNRRSRIPRRTHVRRTRQRKSKRNNYR